MSSQEFIRNDTARTAGLDHAPASPTFDSGKIRMGAGCRIRLLTPRTVSTVDTGKIRMGAGCRIRLLGGR
jgi:hypothetical protein